MNQKAICTLQLAIILVIIVGIVLAVQQVSFLGWDNLQAKDKSLLSLLGLQNQSSGQPGQSFVRMKKCIHSDQYNVWYSPAQFSSHFDGLVRVCISNCSARNDFSPCRTDPPDVCCYSSGDGNASFCPPNCCYTKCRERCDEQAVLASVDTCQQEPKQEVLNDKGNE